LRGRIDVACADEGSWTARAVSGIRAAFSFAADDPAAAQALTNEALAEGKEGFARYDRMLEHFAAGLRPGREERQGGELLPEIAERTMIGGLAVLIAQRLDSDCQAELPALAPEAIQFVLTPYLGDEEARRVAAS
jgi:hypothetical protein